MSGADHGPIGNRIIRRTRLGEGGCWIWTGHLDDDGYGQIRSEAGGTAMAHRASYQTFVGPIPAGLTIDHRCRVRACVNPAHLEAVTQRVNTLRGDTLAARNAAKTHCHRGHEFTAANTYTNPKGHRSCRACAAEHTRRYLARKARAS